VIPQRGHINLVRAASAHFANASVDISGDLLSASPSLNSRDFVDRFLGSSFAQ